MSLGLLNPAGALALAAVGVLVALYLHGRRRRVVPVGTLFLWERVPAHALDAPRFRPDLLFLAQLALLLALIGGYLRPYVEDVLPAGDGVRLLIVLDASASMQAREAGGTRFELARRRARALVAQLLGGDQVMLVAAAERTHVVLRWTSDHAGAQGRLEALEPLDTPTNLGPALELALGELGARPETQVVVFTDLPREATGIAPERLALVDYVQIGQTDDNVAITSLALDQPPFHPVRDASATVLVRNYGHAARRVVLEARVGDQPWTRRELRLAPRGTEHVLLTGPPGAGELRVTLAAGDALAVDDGVVGYLAADEPLDALVVTASRELAASFAELASSIAGARVRILDPAEWTAERGEDARVLVFDGIAPADAPAATPALYVEPPAGNPLCPSERAVEDAAVVDWEVDHPALRGLEALQALTLTRTRVLAAPAWGSALVLAASERGAFPFLVAGEHEGHRIACLGAGPLPSSDSLPLLVLTLGTLRWLEEPAGGAALAVQTGLPVLVEGEPFVAVRTGIHRVGGRIVTANLFDDRESDIGRSGAGEWPAAARPSTPAPAGTEREFGWWLYLAGAGLLGVEWRLWRRRAGAWKRA